MRYRKKEFWRRLAVLEQINQIFLEGSPPGRGQLQVPAREELAGCQAVALEMGTCLESLGAVSGPAVGLLEDYCEELYQQSLHQDDLEICRQIAGKIRAQLGQLRAAIDSLPEGKKEVVFLPYKASMWDSLESVWMAAAEDDSCHAVVLPIPYFDKNPDGSFGQIHDEKNLYPDYVPVTDWQNYSMEGQRPDAIYIHNPYDDGNYVTSVHPAFYARELKKYTDMLVYIPYFVGINGRIEDHFCITAGTIYADRVIVESEEIRQIYIDTIRKFEKENQCHGLFGDLNQKFLPLGSPKLDRIRKVIREDVTIPAEWESIVTSPEGRRKKIILYNTTISSFLADSEAAMKKIRHVLQVFRDHPAVALCWRPHPLLMSTVRSMRPGLYPEFCRMVEEYRKEGWGIYDDTADVERAIALSDAYYGDWSSVVTLYQATGKPIMIQNYEKE